VKRGRAIQGTARRCAARGPVSRAWRLKRSHRRCIVIVFVIVVSSSSRWIVVRLRRAGKRKRPGGDASRAFRSRRRGRLATSQRRTRRDRARGGNPGLRYNNSCEGQRAPNDAWGKLLPNARRSVKCLRRPNGDILQAIRGSCSEFHITNRNGKNYSALVLDVSFRHHVRESQRVNGFQRGV
jgi:hypothetical protein